ncbi:MAG: DUF4147 domain-containing protein [Gammaproteobacteria bacterium]
MPQGELASVRRHALDVFLAGIAAVQGARCVSDYLDCHPGKQDVIVVAIGKAASAMVTGALQVLNTRLRRGLLVTKPGHIEPQLLCDRRITCLTAGHPLPNADSLAAGDALLGFIKTTPADADLLFLISGGASSLVEVLPENITLADLQRVNSWLLGSGLDIHACNHIRSRLSQIKGGRLLHALHGRAASVLMISDVAGDDPAVIGSGLLSSKTTDRTIDTDIPDWLARLVSLAAPMRGGQAIPAGNVDHHIIARLNDALLAAAAHGRALGYAVTLMDERIAEDAAQTGRELAAHLQAAPPGLIIWGGESTVRLPAHPGNGGRNQQLALAAACTLQQHAGLVMLAGATDGSDGPTSAAGARVDAATVDRGTRSGLDAEACLLHADAGTFLAASGDLITTGPTGTNVTDMLIGIKTEQAGTMRV